MRRKRIYIFLLLSALCIVVPSAYAIITSEPGDFDNATQEGIIANFRDIPGASPDEIAAISALQSTGTSFTYGSLRSTEAFINTQGEMCGFAVDFSKRLSEIFEMEFNPVHYEWDALIKGISEGTIDFTGDLIPTPQRKQRLYMTEAIASRVMNILTIEDSESLETIRNRRYPRIAFLKGSVHLYAFEEVYPYAFEVIYVNDFADAAAALYNGDADAFINEGVSDTYFSIYPEIECEKFIPLIYTPVSLTTGQSELEPVISLINKYLAAGGTNEVSALYEKGYLDYKTNSFFTQLTEDEKDYISTLTSSGTLIPVAMETNNYPVSFYNESAKEFQGIAQDVLMEIGALTGLKFETVNRPNMAQVETSKMLQSRQVEILTKLAYADEGNRNFIVSQKPYASDLFALLSTAAYPNLDIGQIISRKVGVVLGSAEEAAFVQWFPSAELIRYQTIEQAYHALEEGEIDLLMASQYKLLSQTNYYANTKLKINILIDHPSEYCFVYHKDQVHLLSVMDKALRFIDTDIIAQRWEIRMLDYSKEITQGRINLLIAFVVSLLIILTMTSNFIIKSNRLRKDLEKTVEERTRELRLQTLTLTTVYESIPDLLYCKDIHNAYTSCNESFERYVGRPRDQLIGKTDSALFGSTEKDEQVLKEQTVEVIEEYLVYPDKSVRLVETLKTPLVQAGKVVGMMGISRDITERKAAEEAAQVASKAKTTFLARMSHEIRTPLNAIVGMAEIAKRRINQPSEVLFSVNQIIRSSHHLLGIINDVLDMSKIESGKLEIAAEPFSLQAAFDDVYTIIGARCEEKALAFIVKDEQIRGMTVIGDKLRLNQVLINLLSNAVKFTDSNGQVAFEVQVMEQHEDSVTIRFTITDNGIGMSTEQISKLFEPFEQADQSIAARFGGTGLGLPISKNLVQSMGGDIAVKSTDGKGSEFSFNLPFQLSTQNMQAVSADIETVDLSNCRILLVEDIVINRFIIAELLSPSNIVIDEAENGQIAVDKLLKSPPGYYDLIFMDIQMPVLDGYEATKVIRSSKHPDAASIPIVAMTANAYKEDVDAAVATGMNGHLAKPIDINQLMETIHKYIKLS